MLDRYALAQTNRSLRNAGMQGDHERHAKLTRFYKNHRRKATPLSPRLYLAKIFTSNAAKGKST